MAVNPIEPEPTPLDELAYGTIHALALRAGPAPLTTGAEWLIGLGLVVRGADGRFTLTPDGYRMHRAMSERERAGIDLSALGLAYARIPAMTRELRALRESGGAGGEELCALVARAEPVLARAAVVVPRFAGYLPRLRQAVARLRAGALDFAVAEEVDSIGVIWRDLQEDFMLTLGRAHDLEEM